MENEIEIWKDIPDYEGIYQASNLGKVKSLSRTTKHNHPVKELIFNVSENYWGYYRVNLYKNGIRKEWKIHRLIALTFLENPNNYPEVHHKNDIKTDNRV